MPDPTANHTVDDPYLVTFLREHFPQASRTIATGVPLEGYHAALVPADIRASDVSCARPVLRIGGPPHIQAPQL